MFVKLDPDHVNWDCYLIKTTGKRIGWKKSGFVFSAWTPSFLPLLLMRCVQCETTIMLWIFQNCHESSSIAHAIWSSNFLLTHDSIINSRKKKKLFDEELFCILWVTIFLTECKSFDAKLGEVVTVLNWI